MIVGVDFDNTIVCYDELFFRTAQQRGLIPPTLARTKETVRDYLRGIDREEDWTALQGLVYGDYIKDAPAFDGVHDFFARCCREDVAVYIVSHKTRKPVLGSDCDLHAAAQDWLTANGFYANGISLARDHVFFEETKQAKLDRIGALGCDFFVDDLFEFLNEPGFPRGVQKVLFDPRRTRAGAAGVTHATSWLEISDLLFQRRRA